MCESCKSLLELCNVLSIQFPHLCKVIKTKQQHTMRKPIFNLAIVATLMAGLVFTGCQSPEQKAETAKTNVEDAAQDLADAKDDKVTADQKLVDEQEWQSFRTDTEAKIKANETRIIELREKKKTSGTKLDVVYTQRIDTLEQRNIGMRTWMNDYENSNTDWALFKREFNHDMDELGKALRDLAVDNKN